MIDQIGKQLDFYVWGDGLTRYGVLGRFGAGVVRNLWAVMRDIASGQLNLRAMSLVYTTLMSIVPLIAVSFSALKAFGVHEEIEPHLYGFLEPLGPKGVEITDYIMNLVTNVNSNVLGGIGFAFFIYTAISMVQKVEDSINYVWYVNKSRSFATRLVEYSTVLIVGTMAVGLAVKAMVEFSKEKLVVEMHENVVFAPVFDLTDRLLPYLITISIFTFLYKFMPNTFVKLRSAIVGGVAGGFLWATTATIFTSFIAGSANRQAIYASLAVAISALIWLYLNWIILLIGSQIAFYFQNPAYLRIGRREPRLSNEMRERVALNIMYLVGREHRNPVDGVDLHSISRALRIPSITLAPIALGLETRGLLTTNEKEKLLPGKEMSRIRLHDILSVVRQDGETGSHEQPRWNDAINALGDTIEASVDDTLGDETLSSLLDKVDKA
jgi:membrane protein